jgi:hypothetical protein
MHTRAAVRPHARRTGPEIIHCQAMSSACASVHGPHGRACRRFHDLLTHQSTRTSAANWDGWLCFVFSDRACS